MAAGTDPYRPSSPSRIPRGGKSALASSIASLRFLLRWTGISIPLALLVGSLVALFLYLLDWATVHMQLHTSTLYGLPLAGLLIYLLYHWWGKQAEAGNNLIIRSIQQRRATVPLLMAPLVLFTTVLTHLFAGSAGREGTAVQIGGSIASSLARWFRLSKADIPLLLSAGVAAGFGAVFGTPIAGAIFALEVLVVGRLSYKALVPCLLASLLSHLVCMAWGTTHQAYAIAPLSASSSSSATFSLFGMGPIHLAISPQLLGQVFLAAIAFGLVARFFAQLTHGIKTVAQRLLSRTLWLVPITGGGAIIALTLALGTRDYNGLGVISLDPHGVSILSAFQSGGATEWGWLWKLLFTAITIGTGFKGGEVTPLFFIGATLGNILAVWLGAPVDLFAGLGLLAVFAAATNTPLASIIMGIELFGGTHLLYFAIACITAYYFSGSSSTIYPAQKGLGKR